MSERSRRPNHSPNRTPEDIEELVVAARRRDPGWGGRKLRCHLINQAKADDISTAPDRIPSASTITRILDRHDMLDASDSPSRQGSWERFERSAPNELWQLDLNLSPFA